MTKTEAEKREDFDRKLLRCAQRRKILRLKTCLPEGTVLVRSVEQEVIGELSGAEE